MNVLRRIARVNRRDQWDNYITNCDIRENLGVTSVGHVQRMRDDRLPKRILSAEGGLSIWLGRIWKLEGLDWTSRLLLAQDRIAPGLSLNDYDKDLTPK